MWYMDSLTFILRLASGFGFLPGKEVKAAGVGNLGLQDRQYHCCLRFAGVDTNLFHRTPGSSLDSNVYPCLRW